MKKLLKSLALVAVSALAMVACRKNEIQESPVAEDEIFFTLTTTDHLSDADDQGKTYMVYDEESKNYNPFWYKGDKIGVFFNKIITTEGNDRTSFDLSLTNSNDNGSEATFEGSTTAKDLPQSGTIYAFYPNEIAKAYAKDSYVGFNILATQHPTATSFDPAADLLIAKPVSYTLSEGEKKTVTIGDVQFARALTVLRLNLYTTDYVIAQGASVTRLTVTSEGNTLGGQPRFDITKDNSAKIIDYNSTSPSVSAEYTGEAVGAATIGAAKGEGGYVFLVVAPAGSLEGKKLVVEGEIEAKGAGDEITIYTFQKTIASLPSSVVLNPGRVLPVAVGLAESNFEEKKPETRLYVEGFDKCTDTPSAGKQYQPSETGVFGVGVTDNLSYYYSEANCNIRKTSGKVAGDPYLYINGVGQYFRIQKLNVPENMPLTFSAWVKENGTLTVKTRLSGSDDTAWEEFGSIVSTTTGTVHKIASADTYAAGDYDFKLEFHKETSGYLRVDDIVIDKDNRITLDTPVVTASLDEEMSNKINVTWEAVENAGSYAVTLQKACDPGYVVESTANTSISFGGLDYNTEYSVSVKALPSDKTLYRDSADSEWQNVTTGAKGVEWKAKTFADLAEGDEVVVVGIKEGVGSRALADNPVGATNPPAVSVTFTNDILDSAPADNIIWVVGVSEDNRIFYVDGNKGEYLFCNTSGVRVGTNTTENNKQFTWADEYLKNIGQDKYIGVDFAEDTPVWKQGAISGNSKIRDEAFKFFVKDDPRTQLATPEITVEAQSIDKKIVVSWAQVPNAASYKVTCTGQTDQTVTLTGCEFTELTPGEYTVTVTAVAQPGTSYKDSQAASKTVTIEDTTPVISYTAPETAEADQTSVEFAYEITWPREDVELQVTKVDEAVDWITDLSVDSENKKVSVTLTENTTGGLRKAQLKLSYTGAQDETLYISQNGAVTKVYASLAALVADGKPTTTGTTVTVTLTNDEINRVSGKNLFFMVGTQEVEIYCGAAHPTEWGTVKAEGKLSGTITCPWKLYVYEQSGDEVWELTPADWTGLSYTAPLEPCATPVITIDEQGSATITCATAGATIYYAVSDTEPTEFTQAYTGAVSLTDGQTIWAQAKNEGYNKPSAVISQKYSSTGGQVVYTLSFEKITGTNYTTEREINCGGINWKVKGQQSPGSYIRVGGSNKTATDRNLISQDNLQAGIKKVVINHSGVGNGTSSSITVNSVSVSSGTETKTITSPSVTSAGTLEFEFSEAQAESTYTITVNYQITGSNNCYLTIDSIDFYN